VAELRSEAMVTTAVGTAPTSTKPAASGFSKGQQQLGAYVSTVYASRPDRGAERPPFKNSLAGRAADDAADAAAANTGTGASKTDGVSCPVRIASNSRLTRFAATSLGIVVRFKLRRLFKYRKVGSGRISQQPASSRFNILRDQCCDESIEIIVK
jgi:hypothetical protein